MQKEIEDIGLNGMIRRMTSKGPDIARQLRSVLDRLNAARQRQPEVGCKRHASALPTYVVGG